MISYDPLQFTMPTNPFRSPFPSPYGGEGERERKDGGFGFRSREYRGTEGNGRRNGNGRARTMKRKPLPELEAWPVEPVASIAEVWTVLRCASAQTLRLAIELRDKGLLAWSPMVQQRRRLPRTRKKETRVLPLLPSFVFVDMESGDKAIDLAERGQVSQCKLFLVNGYRPMIRAQALEPLQIAQQTGMVGATRVLPIGTKVEVLSGLLHYQVGEVIGSRTNGSYMIEIEPAKSRVLVPGFLLRVL
jgi:hypothetical protein